MPEAAETFAEGAEGEVAEETEEEMVEFGDTGLAEWGFRHAAISAIDQRRAGLIRKELRAIFQERRGQRVWKNVFGVLQRWDAQGEGLDESYAERPDVGRRSKHCGCRFGR